MSVTTTEQISARHKSPLSAEGQTLAPAPIRMLGKFQLQPNSSEEARAAALSGGHAPAVVFESPMGALVDTSTRSALAELGGNALLIRGHCVAERDRTAQVTAERVLKTFNDTGKLDLGGLEGSFSIAVIDRRGQEVWLYRNLIGTTNTYYHLQAGQASIGSNLADLVRTLPQVPHPDQASIPSLFIGRYTPGRETLFEGVSRVRPGELVKLTKSGISRQQLHTFRSLIDPSLKNCDPVAEVESVMLKVFAEHAAIDPNSVNLLSGGVDSTLIQALWNKVKEGSGRREVSVTATVDHDVTHGDQVYARGAATELATDHRELDVGQAVDRLLAEHMAAVGEPPNHLQTVYFAPMAKSIAAAGFRTTFCGEGADGLFGNDGIRSWTRATKIHKLARIRPVCYALATFCDMIGKPFSAQASRVAAHLNDVTYLGHPLNQTAVFADWPLAHEAFGEQRMNEILAARRAVLDEYELESATLSRLHGAALLHEALETAALWTACCNTEGVEVVCPFLDSRVMRVALSCNQSIRFTPEPVKYILRKLLSKFVSAEIAFRSKLGFGQPIFQWMAPGGQLSGLVGRLDQQKLLSPAVVRKAREKPTWFLYSAICYDTWARTFYQSEA